MSKTEVYSWRLTPGLKTALEEAAREKGKSVAKLLEEIARDWLSSSRHRADDEEEVQRRLHAAARPFLGAFEGTDPDRATNARDLLRARLAREHAR